MYSSRPIKIDIKMKSFTVIINNIICKELTISKECRAYRDIFVDFCKFVNFRHERHLQICSCGPAQDLICFLNVSRVSDSFNLLGSYSIKQFPDI